MSSPFSTPKTGRFKPTVNIKGFSGKVVYKNESKDGGKSDVGSRKSDVGSCRHKKGVFRFPNGDNDDESDDELDDVIHSIPTVHRIDSSTAFLKPI